MIIFILIALLWFVCATISVVEFKIKNPDIKAYEKKSEDSDYAFMLFILSVLAIPNIFIAFPFKYIGIPLIMKWNKFTSNLAVGFRKINESVDEKEDLKEDS